jgi:hypothetical protein
VAVNVAELVVPGTRTDAGTSAVVLFEPSVTVLPPAGAAWFKVTVHVVVAPETTLAGLQTSQDTATGGGVTVTVAVVLPLSVAVTVTVWVVAVTVWVVATEPAVVVNVVDVDVAGTVTDAGTGSAAVLLEPSVTVLPPAGAAGFRVTVHVVALPEVRLAGLQTSEETVGGGGATVTVAVVLPLSVAVTVTVSVVATVPAVAVNVVDIVVAGTVTDAGTGSAVVLFEPSVTALPPVGAA